MNGFDDAVMHEGKHNELPYMYYSTSDVFLYTYTGMCCIVATLYSLVVGLHATPTIPFHCLYKII